MPSFEPLPLLKSRFFMVQDFHISEVLKSGGIFTISNRLMANCDVLTISGFLARVADLEGWSVYVPSFVYNCFKQKVIKMPAGYKDNESLKKAYNLLKHGCLEAQQLDYLSQLRNMFWKDNRYFYLIDTEGNTENSISISQAIRIVGT
ncbi:hypothetical protein PAEPH01_1094 [Pancytospora epiphaga]|nr:hypothetical protein PAEPH01_1094 [Pancytospora epiphaga]